MEYDGKHSLINNKYDESLAVKVLSANNEMVKLDFNRLRYLYVPTTKKIINESVKHAKRDVWVYEAYKEIILENMEIADATKHNYFRILRYWVYCSDKKNVNPFTKSGIETYVKDLIENFRSGKWKGLTCSNRLATFGKIVDLIEGLEKKWLPQKSIFDQSDSKNIEAYSNDDLKKRLIPFISEVFKQFSEQFTDNPEHYIKQYFLTKSFSFSWNGKVFREPAGITKLICSAYYLMSFYTFSNSTQLFNLKRPDDNGTGVFEKWYEMSVEKRRAVKYVSIEIGENDSVDIPKHALHFIDKQIEISKMISSDDEGLLFPLISRKGEVIPLNSGHLKKFNDWVAKVAGFRDEYNRKINLSAQRFRVTGRRIMEEAGLNKIAISSALQNTPQTLDKSYSEGNKYENTKQMQAVTLTLENMARSKKGIEIAKKETMQQMSIEILPYDKYMKMKVKPVKTACGTHCKNPYDVKSKKFKDKAIKHGLVNKKNKLACADIKSCFSCVNQVIVEEVDDLWCLLSFRDSVEESSYIHNSKQHFEKNYIRLLKNIKNILKFISPTKIREAEKKLAKNGRHPMWPEEI